MRIKKVSLLSILVYFCVFFPYITLINLGTDTQPWAFLVSLIIILLCIFLKNEKMPKSFIPLLVVAIISIFVALVNGFSNTSIRSVFGYISIFFVAWASYIVVKKEKGVNEFLVKIIVLIWAVVGLIQTTVLPNFLELIVSDMRTTVGRGVTSLAPEPTYYGQMMFFLLFVVLLFFKKTKDKIIYSLICFIQIAVFAKSTMIAFVLGLVLIVFVINLIFHKWSIKTVLIMSVLPILVILTIVIIGNLNSDLRIITSINNILDNPVSYFKNDASANDRLSGIYFSFKGAIESFLIPNGFEKWVDYIAQGKLESEFFWYGETTRIMSMYGAVLFELGIFGLMIMFVINKWILRLVNIQGLKKYKLTIIMSINLIFLTAVPLATPFIGFILGSAFYYISNFAQHEIEIVNI